MTVLVARNISKAFGGVQAVRGLSFELPPQAIYSIIGPNGAGKTTAFNLLTGIYPLDGGEIFLEGKPLHGRPQHEIARAGIGRTFQNIRLFKGLTVVENVMTAADPHSRYGLLEAAVPWGRKRTCEKAVRDASRGYLELVGLGHHQEAKAEGLPYGMQRKLEVARALAGNPKVLLLDEPAAGLNPREVAEFIDLIRSLHERFRFSIMVIEHRMEVVMELSERIFVLNFGELLASGTPEEIRRNREVTAAYIGEEEEDAACSS